MIGEMDKQRDDGGANVTRRRMPDLDFDDVFGGAPNRFFGSGSDSEPYRRRGVRHLADGFFDDIFRCGASSSSVQLPLRDLQNQEIQDYGLSREDSTGKEDAAGIKLTEDSTLVKSQRMPLWTSASAESEDIKVSEQNLVNTANPPKNDDETVELKGQKLIRTVGAPFKANEVPIFLEEKVISDRIGEKEVRNNIVEDPAQAREINAEIEEEISSGVHGATQSSATTTINEIPRKPKPESATLAVDKELLVTPQGQCATAWDIDIILENIDELYADIEEPRNEIEDHMVEILNWEHNDLLPSDSRLEEDKNADVILREWLSGREGNIRSLISTLQYVLWPGSGWKKIPLVDLVEITSVRKAYSKALLSLHPDKLQQKGATTHQKYIAEKVFDVLQEAWSQFTSISPM